MRKWIALIVLSVVSLTGGAMIEEPTEGYYFIGSLDDEIPVELVFERNIAGTIAGYICYTRTGTGRPMLLVGEDIAVDPNVPDSESLYHLLLKEYQPDGLITGIVEIYYTEVEGDYKFESGTWTNPATGKTRRLKDMNSQYDLPAWFPGTPVALRRPPRYHYKMSPRPISSADDRYNDSIEVAALVDDHVVRVFKHRMFIPQEMSRAGAIEWVREDDINFDGHPDLMIYLGDTGWGGCALPTYEAYVWNPATGAFDYVEDFNSIAGPRLDSESHQVRSDVRVEYNSVDHAVYRWDRGNRLVEVERYSTSMQDDEDVETSTLPARGDYYFVNRLVKDDRGRYCGIEVKGYADGDTPRLECARDLVDCFEARQVDGIDWVREEDINFDGVPDLLIYLGLKSWGHVAEIYDAYTWNESRRRFEYVEGFDAIDEPQFDARRKVVTSTFRSGADEVTERTYRWVGNKLELESENKGKIGDQY